MNINELAGKIVAKRAERGFVTDPVKLQILITEEIGEMSREVKKFWAKSYGPFKRERLAEEMADVLCLIFAMAAECNIDLEESIARKFFGKDDGRK